MLGKHQDPARLRAGAGRRRSPTFMWCLLFYNRKVNNNSYGWVTQLVECDIENVEVIRSNRIPTTMPGSSNGRKACLHRDNGCSTHPLGTNRGELWPAGQTPNLFDCRGSIPHAPANNARSSACYYICERSAVVARLVANEKVADSNSAARSMPD